MKIHFPNFFKRSKSMSSFGVAQETSVAVGAAPVPGPVTNLVVSQPDVDADTILVAFTAPATDDQGRPLKDLSGVEIRYHEGGSIIAMIEGEVGLLPVVTQPLAPSDIGQPCQVEVPKVGWAKTLVVAVRPFI